MAGAPKALSIDPLNVDTEKSAATDAGRESTTEPLTVSAASVAPEVSAPANDRLPETVSTCAREKVPPLTSSRPLTVEACSSPLAPRTVTLPLTDSTWVSLLAPETSTEPFTVSAWISRAWPVTVMLPLTVSAFTVPLTSDTLMLPAKLSIWSRLRTGTCTSSDETTPCGLRSVSTPTRMRPPEPVKSSPEAPAPSCPVTITSLRSQPTTRMDPAGFSISTSASAEAARRASTFWASPPVVRPRHASSWRDGRAERPCGPAARARQRDSTVRVGIIVLLESVEAHHALERVELLLVRGREQVGELRAAGVLLERGAHPGQGVVDGLQVRVEDGARLGRERVLLLV